MAEADGLRNQRRVQLVEEHVRHENAHDLEGILATFGDLASYHDEPWQDHREGADGVAQYYRELLAALPDLKIEIVHCHAAADAVILEVIISGTHGGAWRGLPATGRCLQFPLCGLFTFDDRDRLASERIYYDRASVLRQLGVFFEPTTLAGRLVTALSHPLTIARAYGRLLLKPKARDRVRSPA